MTRFAILVGCAAVGAFIAACGGSSPGVQHRTPDRYLTSAPPAQRTAVADAYRDHLVAKARLEHTRFQASDVAHQLKIARTERGIAQQRRTLADLEKQRREQSFMTKLAGTAKQSLDRAAADSRSGDRKIRWLEGQRRYLQSRTSHLEAEVVATEAKLELAKATLAKKHSAPAEFQLAPFAAQAKRMASSATQRQRRADNAYRQAESLRKEWGGK